jgi:hypothetical protein
MNARTCLLVIASALGLIVVGAVVGNVLQSTGILNREALGPRGIAAVKLFYVILFCVLGFAAVPLLIKYFIDLQIRLGNGDISPVKWLQAHERSVVYGFWAMVVVGLSMALPAAVRNGFFK